MREIKFRVWDNKEKQFIANGNSVDLYYSMRCGCFMFDNDDYDLRGRDIIISQYTGLKDNNGKEIYEGDILYCHEYDSSDCGKRIVQTFKNAVVGFGQGNYYYYPKGNMRMPHQLLMYAYKPEVIGNIYENPELVNN